MFTSLVVTSLCESCLPNMLILQLMIQIMKLKFRGWHCISWLICARNLQKKWEINNESKHPPATPKTKINRIKKKLTEFPQYTAHSTNSKFSNKYLNFRHSWHATKHKPSTTAGNHFHKLWTLETEVTENKPEFIVRFQCLRCTLKDELNMVLLWSYCSILVPDSAALHWTPSRICCNINELERERDREQDRTVFVCV